MSEKILFIDDDEKSCEEGKLALEAEGLLAEICSDGRTGLKKALEGKYSVIILDTILHIHLD